MEAHKSRFSNGLLGQWVKFRRNAMDNEGFGEIAFIGNGRVVIIDNSGFVFERSITDMIRVLPEQQPSEQSQSDEELPKVTQIVHELLDIPLNGYLLRKLRPIPDNINLPELHISEFAWNELPYSYWGKGIGDSYEWRKLPNDKGHQGKPQIILEVTENNMLFFYSWTAVIHREARP